MPKVNTFIIPIIHGGFIGKFLETLWKYTEPNFYVFVIDQCQDDEAYIKYHKNTHLWIKAYRNLGFAKAHNTGIRLSQTKYISLYNDDVEFINKHWWKGITDTFEMSDRIVAVNPMSPKEGAFGYGLTEENDKTWVPKKGFVREGGFVVPELPNGKGFSYKDNYTQEDYDFLINSHPLWNKDTVCDGLCMWGTTFSREGLNEVGMLDERFYPGNGEDYDMCGRAYSCAWPISREVCDEKYHKRMVSTTKSWVWHHWGKSKEFSFNNRDKIEGVDKPGWNHINELWPEGFDTWGHKNNADGTKTPYIRDPLIYTEEL